MIETSLLAATIAVSLHIARTNAGNVRRLWQAAHWYEKVALCLMFVPIPGPLDELITLLALRRVAARVRSKPGGATK